MNKEFFSTHPHGLRAVMLLLRPFSAFRSPSNLLFLLFFSLLVLPGMLSGQTPVPLTAGSFNWDAIGENGCTPPNPLTIATAGGMDASGYAFNGTSGWPGSLSYTLGGNPYTLRPYTGTNALRVMPSSSATLTLASPTRLANLHFLVTSTEGSSTATYTANFTDATSQTLMTANTPDWIVGGGTFISNATSTNDCDVKGAGHLFEESGNIASANYGKFVSSITVSRGAGGGRLFIFAASSCGAGAFFNTCPGNISVSCPGVINYTASATGATSLTYSFSGATSGSGSGTGSGSSFNNGVTNVTLTATNSCGTQTCSFSVTVQDNTPPTAICQNASVNLTNAGTGSIPASAVNNGSFDNCSSVTLSPAQFNFFCVYGTQTVTLTVTDATGNPATCTATVTVNDPIVPAFTYCPPNMTVNVDPGQCNARVCYPSPQATDNCSPLTPAGYTYFNQNGTGPITSYYYISTGTSDYATASANARAAGGHLAVITSATEQSYMPAGVRWLGGSDALVEGTFLWETCEPFSYTHWAAGEPNNQSGIEDHMATWTAGFWNDVNIAGPYGAILEIEGTRFVQTAGLTQNAVFPLGPTTNTFVSTDAAGNTATCQFTVTVVDNQPPTAVCQNVSVNLAGNSASITAAQINNGSSDLCSTVSLSASPTTFNCSNVGPNNVTLTVTDAANNSATCNAVVTVVDNTPPVAVCQNITVNLAGSSVTITASQINNGSSDNCGFSLSVIPTTFNCNQVGQNLVQLTVTDASNNTATCFSQVTVVDNTPPVAVCQNISVALVGASVNIIAAQINGGSSDNCSFTLSASPTSFNCSNVGPNNVTLTVTSGTQSATCTAVVTVVDNTLPVAVCQNITVPLVGASASIIASQVNNGSSDNCFFSLSASPTSFTCANVGPNNVTLTVTDASNNFSTCPAVVTVVDNTLPVAVCQNVTIYLNAAGNGSTTAAAVNNGSNDACGIASLSLSPSAFTCANVGANTVTLTVTDNNSNVSTCTATVTVVDNIAPVATCQNVTVYLNASGNGSTTAAAVNNGSSDACGIASLILSPSAFTCANVGANTVTLTVTDNNSNTSTCTATVTVVDNIAPVATCQNVTVILNASGNGSTTAAAVNNGSSDACGIASLILIPSAFTCANVGANTVTLTVTDNNSNTSTCTATVTVVDNLNPTITCPAPITVNNDPGQCSAVVSYTVTGSDNCSFTLTKTSGIASGQPHPVGVTTNTWKATDASGNMATCSFTVTVLKTGDPGLLWAYTVIGFDEVKMKTNTVQSGGVGVVNAGKKVKLEHATMVTAANTFVKAPILDLNGGSMVTTYYPGQVSASLLPAFQPNTAPCNNDVTIADNSAPVTLSLACYGKITVGKNVSVTFSGHAVVTARELKLKEGSSAFFAQSTNLLIDKKLDTDKYVDISNNGHSVWIFAEDHVKIDDGNDVTANVYCQKHIHVDKTPAGNPTYMTGIFIAEKVDSKENVFWNWDATVCPYTPPLLLGTPAGDLGLVAALEEVHVQLQWVTNMNGEMEVERSTDGVSFATMLSRESDASANAAKLYHDYDENPAEGINYYRIKQAQPDGSLAYSPVREVVFNPGSDFTIFPNPASERVNVYVKRFLGKEVDLVIANNLGQELYRQHIPEVKGKLLQLDLDRKTFGEGLYSISIIHRGRAQSKRLVLLRAD